MASFDSKVRNQLPKPLMLKDYLLDDLSSCSSNGFRSYPRRQCCTSVRFLLEIDHPKNRDSKKRVLRTKSKATSSSAFQRASEAVVKAIKLLPFASVKPPLKQNKPKRTFLPRSLSKKLLRRSFWKKTSNEIERWKSFGSLLGDEQKPLDFIHSVTESNGSTSQSNSNSIRNSWSDSDFSVDYLQCENDVVVSENSLMEKVVSGRGGVKDGDDSTEGTTKATNSAVQCNKEQWPNEEEKEQFSPVSVLDFPFHDEEEVSSPFQTRLDRLQGTKQQLLQKIQCFERLAQLKPVNLEKPFSDSGFGDDIESLKSPLHSCSTSIQENIMLDKEEEEEENEIERKVLELVELMKATIPSTSLKFVEDSLLLEDYFRESISEANYEVKDGDILDFELLKEAKGWINGQNSELLLSWEVEKKRQSYLGDMEKGGVWRKLDDEDKEEVAMDLEVEIFDSLVHELLLELMLS